MNSPLPLRVLTVNIHKSFGALGRRFVLHDLREAVRAVNADLVFLPELQGVDSRHSARVAEWPPEPHYEFLAATLWPQFAYGRNAVYPSGHHGNAVLSRYPIVDHQNHDVSIGTHEARGLLHCKLCVPGIDGLIHAVCVHLSLFESHRRQQTWRLCKLVNDTPEASPVLLAGDFNDWRNLAHRHVRNARAHNPLRLPAMPWARLSNHAPLAAEITL